MPTAPKTPAPRLRELPPKVAREIAKLKAHQLVRYKDENGNRLHPSVIKAENIRRVREAMTPGHENESLILRRHRQWQARRVLGAPVKPRKRS